MNLNFKTNDFYLPGTEIIVVNQEAKEAKRNNFSRNVANEMQKKIFFFEMKTRTPLGFIYCLWCNESQNAVHKFVTRIKKKKRERETEKKEFFFWAKKNLFKHHAMKAGREIYYFCFVFVVFFLFFCCFFKAKM